MEVDHEPEHCPGRKGSPLAEVHFSPLGPFSPLRPLLLVPSRDLRDLRDLRDVRDIRLQRALDRELANPVLEIAWKLTVKLRLDTSKLGKGTVKARRRDVNP